MRVRTSAVSGICGTHLGETKAPASMTESPVSLRRFISSTLMSVVSVADSFCSPSRGLTSTILTARGIMSHPEDAEARRRRRHVPDNAQAAAEHIARCCRSNHAIVPQPRAGVIGMALCGVLLADVIGAGPFFGVGLVLSRFALDAREHLGCLFPAH